MGASTTAAFRANGPAAYKADRRAVYDGGDGGEPAPFVGILDQLSTAPIGAWSLRLLRANYSGSAIRVRRSGDNAEQDIGYVEGILDVPSLLSFCGLGSGFVAAWYDQSSNGRNFVQGTAGSQARIVNMGVVEQSNSRPCVIFPDASDFMTTASFNAHSGSQLYTASVFTHGGTASQARTFSGQANNVSQNDHNSLQSFAAAVQVFGGGAYCVERNSLLTSAGTTSMTALTAVHCRWDGTDKRISYNDDMFGAGGASAGSFSVEILMLNTEYAFGGFTGAAGARHSEHIVFPTNLGIGDQTSLKSDQTSYYSLA